jgi:hypothetical protein
MVPTTPSLGSTQKQRKLPSEDQDTEKSGLISTLEVSESHDWDCMVCFIKESEEQKFEEFLKPSLEEPPLYIPSEELSEDQKQLVEKLRVKTGL